MKEFLKFVGGLIVITLVFRACNACTSALFKKSNNDYFGVKEITKETTKPKVNNDKKMKTKQELKEERDDAIFNWNVTLIKFYESKKAYNDCIHSKTQLNCESEIKEWLIARQNHNNSTHKLDSLNRVYNSKY